MIQKKQLLRILASALIAAALLGMFCGCSKSTRVTKQTKQTTCGIDVARYQGTIDWAQAAASEIDFAIVRLGYRTLSDGVIQEDGNARYNLQEASKHGIPLGAYFFSTAITEEEAVEEAQWIVDLVAQYPITYPIVYDCERFREPESRQYGMSPAQRTQVALAFLNAIEEAGYEGMFYGSKNELETQWEISRIESNYKIWVAQYPEQPYPDTAQSSYRGEHHMWQYTHAGSIPGIGTNVDLNVAYFGYDGIEPPKDATPPEQAQPDVEAMMDFTESDELVTAKIETNLRSAPSQDADSQVLYTLQNGETAHQIAVSSAGWSKLIFEGQTYYALTSYLTPLSDDSESPSIQTPFESVNDRVTAKEKVNLRTMPSVEHPDCKVIAFITHGEVVTRTGINRDVGWSRVVYNGQTLYCISSYLTEAPAGE